MERERRALLRDVAVEQAGDDGLLQEFGYKPVAYRFALLSPEDAAAWRYDGAELNATSTAADDAAALAAELRDDTCVEAVYQQEGYREELRERFKDLVTEYRRTGESDGFFEQLESLAAFEADAHQPADADEMPDILYQPRPVVVDTAPLETFADEMQELIEETLPVDAVRYTQTGTTAGEPDELEEIANTANLGFELVDGGEAILFRPPDTTPYWTVFTDDQADTAAITHRLQAAGEPVR